MEVARLVEKGGELVGGRRGERVRTESVHRWVGGNVVLSQQLGPGPLLGAELAQAQFAPVLETQQHSRGAVAKRGSRVEQL